MCQGAFLLRDSCDGLPLIGNIYLAPGPEEAFRKKRNLRLWINHLKITGQKKIHETTFFLHVCMRWICMNAAWKKSFDCSMRRKKLEAVPQGMQEPFIPCVYKLWILFGAKQILLEWAAPMTQERFIHWDVVLAKVSFSVISEWRQSRVL